MPGLIGKYEIKQTLGKGASCTVKLGVDKETGRKVAIKIIRDDLTDEMKDCVNREILALQQITSHTNVEQLIDFNYGTYEDPKRGKSKPVSYIVMELASGGELFDYIITQGNLKEPTARYFFKQLISGLAHVHRNGITHRDLKADNILLDENFQIKIADFGFATKIEGADGKGVLTTKLGTVNYMAPEIWLDQPYQGARVDLFAAAVILFIMVSGHLPFQRASAQDTFYKCIGSNRAEQFWKAICQHKEDKEEFFSEDFKDLISGMLQVIPSHRPTLSEVLGHPWMQGPTPSYDEVVQEFQQREEASNKEVDQQQEQNEGLEKKMDKQQFKVNRSDVTASVSAKKFAEKPDTEKKLKPYERVFTKKTEFFSSFHPDEIEKALCKYLSEQHEVEPEIHPEQYKIKFKLTSQNLTDIQHTEICVKIMQVDDTTVCVDFQKVEGSLTSFYFHFTDIVKNALYFAKDKVYEHA